MGRKGYASGRSALNKILYNCCRTLVDPQHRESGDLVRVKRAGICREITTKTRGEAGATPHHEELTIEELNKAIE